MSVGDVTNPRRVRMQANERLDTVDVDGFSVGPREHLDAFSRAVSAAPRNVGSAVPTGFVFQGFGLTLNPTSGSDGKVRVQSPVGVAFDADGRLLIKEAGVQVDLTLASGNTQVYAYYVDVDSDTAVRRRISVSSPYVESGQAIPTKVRGNVGFFTRPGDQTAIVASDVVNGATTPLCFLGVANNAAGVITMTGYDATTAPNGAFATNRITTVVAPTSLPAATTTNGSITTTHGLISAVAYMVGQALWKGSAASPPSITNNFQAWTVHPTHSVATLSEYLAAGNLLGNHTIGGSLAVGGQPLTFSRPFTADNTTETFTVVAHGRSTGDGPFQTSTTGVLPTGLSAATNYWWIATGADTYMLATSFADAVAGLNLSISTNGTGTHTVASTGSTVHATDATVSRSLSVGGNATVGGTTTSTGLVTASAGVTAGVNRNVGVSGTGKFLHGTRTQRFPAVLGAGLTQGTAWNTENGGGIDQVPFVFWQIPIFLPDGKRITAARARVKDNATGPSKIAFTTSSDVDTVSSAFGGAAVVSSGSGAFQTLSRTGLTTTVTPGTTYYALLLPSGGTAVCIVQWIEVDYDELV